MQQEPSSTRPLLARLCSMLIPSPVIFEPTRPLVTLETRFAHADVSERKTDYRYQASPLQSSKLPAAANRLLMAIMAAALVASAAPNSPSANAAEITWTGAGSNNNWGNAGNWNTLMPLPNNGTADLDFGAAAGGSTTSNAEVAYSIHSLNFDSLASAYTITGAQITLGTGGLSQNALAGQLIQNAIVVGADQTWRFGSNSGLLNLTGGVNLGSASRTLTLEAVGASSISAVFTGANGKLVKSGTGTLTYSGVGSSIPLGEVNAGTLVVASGASFLTTNFTINAGGAMLLNGTINSPNSFFQVTGNATTAASVALASGGSLTTSFTGINANGSFTQNGGTHTASSLVLEGSVATPGAYTLAGGTLTTNTTTVGFAANGTFMQLGGTHTTTTLNLGNTANTGSGLYSLSGASQLNTTNTYIGRTGVGVFTHNSGTHTIAEGLFVGADGGNGTYTLNGGTVDAGETYVVGNPAVFDLNGGTLRTGGVTLGPNPTFNFNGGTLQAKRDNPEFVRFPGNVFVRAGGAVIDSNGHTVGIRSMLLHDAALGNTPDGGLTKTGAGTLILTGQGYSGQTTGNTYTGATTVNAGTLLVNNTNGSGTGSGNVTVNSGARLGGTGTISGAVSIANGGTLAPGTSVGTLRTGSLSLASGGSFVFELDGANGTSDRVDVTGAVNLGGGNLVLSLLSAATLGQTFDLLHNDGSDLNIGFFASGSTVTGTFNGGTYVFAINYTANNDGGSIGNDISLVTVAVPEPSTWAFALSGVGLLGGYQYFRRNRRRRFAGNSQS